MYVLHIIMNVEKPRAGRKDERVKIWKEELISD